MCAKFNHCSFTRSGDMVGAHQNVNGPRGLTTSLSGMVCHSGLALATINLPTKFKVYISTHYEDRKGDTR